MKTSLIISVLALCQFAASAENPKPPEKIPAEKPTAPQVPENLERAHQELREWFSDEEIERIKKMPSKNDIIAGFLEIRTDMHSMWRLSGDSPLANYFRDQGLMKANDMSALILDTFWQKQVGKEYDLNEVVADYKLFRIEDTPPTEAMVDPIDKSLVNWHTSLGAPGRPHRRVYIGNSEGTGREVAFEHGKGVYLPGDEIAQLMKEIEAEMGINKPEGFDETYGNVPTGLDHPDDFEDEDDPSDD